MQFACVVWSCSVLSSLGHSREVVVLAEVWFLFFPAGLIWFILWPHGNKNWHLGLHTTTTTEHLSVCTTPKGIPINMLQQNVWANTNTHTQCSQVESILYVWHCNNDHCVTQTCLLLCVFVCLCLPLIPLDEERVRAGVFCCLALCIEVLYLLLSTSDAPTSAAHPALCRVDFPLSASTHSSLYHLVSSPSCMLLLPTPINCNERPQ